MRIDSLLYAIEIERCGSINRAAQNLYLSQSNLSAHLKALEEDLGYQIFHRTPSGISLTPEGFYFLQSAKAIQAETEKIRRIPEMVHELESISISCTWSSRFLQCFIDFKATNQPDAQDAYKETGLIQNFQDIQQNQYRMAIIYCFHSRSQTHITEARKTNLEAEVIAAHFPAVALVGKGHPLAGKESVTLSDLHQYPMALFEDFEDADWIHILKTPSSQSILYLFDRGAIIDAVSSGGYISVSKKRAVLNDGINSLEEIPISDLEDDIDILLLRRNIYEPSRREREFVEYLKSCLSKE